MIAYKLCRKHNGHYYPLYVNTTEEFIIGKKYKAKEGPKTENGKVHSKLGELSYRPGIHLSDIPLADHIGKRMPDGRLFRKPDTAWLVCRFCDNIDYTEFAQTQPQHCLRTIPENGYYWFNTNSQAKANWIITSWVIPLRELTREEEVAICKLVGFEAQPMAF